MMDGDDLGGELAGLDGVHLKRRNVAELSLLVWRGGYYRRLLIRSRRDDPLCTEVLV